MRILAAATSDGDGDGGKVTSFKADAPADARGEAGNGARIEGAGSDVRTHYEANVPGLLKGTERAGTSPTSTKTTSHTVGVASVDSVVEEAQPAQAEEEEDWASRVLAFEAESGTEPLEGSPLLRERGWEVAYALRRDERVVGLMLVDAEPEALTYEVRSVARTSCRTGCHRHRGQPAIRGERAA